MSEGFVAENAVLENMAAIQPYLPLGKDMTMFKKLSIILLIALASLTLVALMPAPVSGPSSPAAQETVVAATVIVPTIGLPGDTPAPAGDGSTDFPSSTLIIIGLLMVLALAIIVGGMAMARRE